METRCCCIQCRSECLRTSIAMATLFGAAGRQWREAPWATSKTLAAFSRRMQFDLFTYNAAISACNKAGRWVEALWLLMDALRSRLPMASCSDEDEVRFSRIW